MKRIRRLLKIISVTLRYRLDTLTPWCFLPSPKQARGERFRLALEALGPIFVKFGQLLSTRRDLLPDDIADELALLQDQVPPFPQQQAVALIEASLGQPVSEVFADFDHTPLASASIAQIHAATLHSGEDVVVKVVRPDIDKTIKQDIALLFMLAKLIQRFSADGKRLHLVEVIEDYQHTILDELDLQKEAANTSQLRRNFADSELLYVPEVYWDYTSHNVLVMERIHGIPVTDMAALKQQNTNMKVLAERGVEIFFTQLLRDNFFHADMHPGNIFIARDNPDSPQYIAIDCAIIGSLSDSDQYYLARNLLAIFKRDYHLVAQLHIECGWIPKHTRAQDFEAAIRSVCEPIFQKPIGEISLGKLLIYLFQTARRFDMEVQPSLVLLQKTLLNIEGLGKELYPQLNLWDTAQPYLEQWLKDRYSPKSMYRKIQNRLPGWLEQLPSLPDQLFDMLQQQQAIQQQLQQGREQIQQQFQHRQKRQRWMKTATAALLAAACVSNPTLRQSIEQLPPLSGLLILLATALWIST